MNLCRLPNLSVSRKDFATPLPVLVIAQMMGVPKEDRPYVRHLAEKLLNIGRGEPDRMRPLVEGMHGMIEYVAPLVNERLEKPGDDFISVLAQGEKKGVFTRHQDEQEPEPGLGRLLSGCLWLVPLHPKPRKGAIPPAPW